MRNIIISYIRNMYVSVFNGLLRVNIKAKAITIKLIMSLVEI